MQRIAIAAALAITVPVVVANAAGPFDGQYTGGSPSVGRTCPSSAATVTVANGKMTGEYKMNVYTFHINGTVAPDGTVTGKWSVYPLTGKFTGTHFAGSYDSKECGAQRPITLDKTG